MVLTLAIISAIVGRRNGKYDDEHYDEAFDNKKQDHCDMTVAGETFVSEINDSTYDGNASFRSSSSSVVQHDDTARRRTESSVERNAEEEHEHHGISQREDEEPISPQRRPRTVAEIEQLLSLGYDGVI